jgi:hypothetical protein
MKVIASLTTIPQRIDKIKGTLLSLLAQSHPIDHIEINVPYRCVRTNEDYVIPAWLTEMPKVEIHRTEDYGAITKISPTLVRHMGDCDAYIWSVDDDHNYQTDTLAGLVKIASQCPHDIIAYSINDFAVYIRHRSVIDRRKRSLLGILLRRHVPPPRIPQNDESIHFQFFEGFQTVLYPPHIIDTDFADYIKKTAESMDCRKSDDMVLSYYFRKRCRFVKAPAHKSNAMYAYGRDAQALHLQDNGHRVRYQRVVNWLRANCPIN